MDKEIVGQVLNFIRWDGTTDAYVRFLTLEDRGE